MGLGLYCCEWTEDERRLAGAEAALHGFWEDYLGYQAGEVR